MTLKFLILKKKNDMNFCFSFNGNKTITTGAGEHLHQIQKYYRKGKDISKCWKKNKKV